MKNIIIGNWKMNPRTAREARSLALAVSKATKSVSRKVDIVLAPPFPFLSLITNHSSLKLGAQDVFWENPPAGGGAFTGEVSTNQLNSFGVRYVIVGHSERRALGETNEIVHKKLKTILKADMKAVLCVGEREHRHYDAFPVMVRDEIHEALNGIPKSLLKNLIIAYEPIWAIGTGKPATPKNIFEITILIRRELFRLFGKNKALHVPILYGGSVDNKNAALFISEGRTDGLLVGGASVNQKMFLKIIESVACI